MTTSDNTQIQDAAVAAPTARLFDPRVFRFTFMRAVRSELDKMIASIGFWITSIAVVVLSSLVAILSIVLDDRKTTTFYPEMVTGGWKMFYIFFLIPIAVLAVSSEYSHNTMRTTVLAVPNRTTAFFAKMTAVFIYCGLLSAAIILFETASIFVLGDISTITENSVRALIMCWLVLTTLALASAGLAYLLRSTAASIVIMLALLLFLDILLVIPSPDFREFLLTYLPNQVGDAAMASSGGDYTDAPPFLSWGAATGVWIAYMAVPIAAGFARFTKSDV